MKDRSRGNIAVLLFRQQPRKNVGKVSQGDDISPYGQQRRRVCMTLVEKRVDPRVKRTRQLLQRAFLELFAEKGMASISIQDITDRATVNRATFYAHFPDKYALLDSIVREQFQQALAQHLPSASVWNVQSLRALVRATFGFLG